MKYFGGKARISKHLAEYLNSQITDDQNFYDLFCGACNVITKITATNLRYANDLHPSIVATMKACAGGYEFPHIVTEEDYQLCKKEETYNRYHPLHGFMMFGCSFSGKYKGGYARSGTRNYALNAKNSLAKKAPHLQNIIWSNKSYDQVDILPNSVVYCDIPYFNTTKYSVEFGHEEFYKWVERQDSTIFISEYEQGYNPLNLPIVWQKESKQDIRSKDNTRKKTTEVLLRYN